MRALVSLLALVVMAAACRVVASREVLLPIEGPTYRVECHYELANCLRSAEERCGGRFEQITRQSCPRCGSAVPAFPQTRDPILKPGYRGTLYFRCL